MKSNYKRLGDYIEVVEERNRDLSVTLSQGICNLKYFQNPRQVAENSAADKIVRKGWFAYNRATTRNGDKISIAYRDGEDCTVSASYLTFKIKDENLLNPYYLMMWFKRAEFDRYARFKSHGSAHEYFEWEEMCEVMLPVPSIEEQRKIVAEYQAVEQRIENNRRLIATLEDAAQTIYRKMFVDNLDPNDLPKGWRMGKFGDIVELSQGIQVEVEDQFPHALAGFNRFIRIIDYTPETNEPPRFVNITDKRYYCSEYEVSMIRYGDAGKVCRRLSGIIANNLFKISPVGNITNNFIYYFLNDSNIQRIIRSSAASSTMPAITHKTIKELDCYILPKDVLILFDKYVNPIESEILNRMHECNCLRSVLSLLLTKLSNI